jgi:hypothetical protein
MPRMVGQIVTPLGSWLDECLWHEQRLSADYKCEQFFPRFGFSRVAREEVPSGVLSSIELQSTYPTRATVIRLSNQHQ